MGNLLDDPAFLKQMFLLSPNAIILSDIEGKIVLANPYAEKLFGYGPEELVGLSMETLISKQFRAEVMRYKKNHSLLPSRPTFRALRKDGSEFDAEMNIGQATISTGTFTHAIVADISARKRDEDRLNQFVAILEQTADSVIIADISGTILHVNRSFEVLTGYASDEVIGKKPSLFKSGHHDLKLYQELWRTILSGQIFRCIFTNKKKNGILFQEQQTITPIKDKSGRITQFVAIGRDITAEQKLQAHISQAQKMESVGQLAGGIAHDFNNLLTAIQGYADFSYMALPPDSPVRPDIQEIIKASKRAAILTQQLLAFSRKQTLQVRVVNLGETLLNVQKLLRPLIMENIEIAMVIRPNLWLARVDPNQIEQILLNLAINARDSMPQGGKLLIHAHNVNLDENYANSHPEVTPGEYVAISIGDTGTGMTEEVQAHLFEPFFTTKGPGKGTGLGLATSYGIIKQHGGHISCYSELGQGTTFRVYIPKTQDKEEATNEPEKKSPVVGGNEKILLVEDEPSVRKFATTALARLGYDILSASYPDEAVKLFLENPPPKIDLLVTDVVMPKMSGKDLADKIRAINPNLKILFMSGYTNEQLGDRGILDAKTPFIEKPFTMEKFAQKIREVLDQPQASAGNSSQRDGLQRERKNKPRSAQ